MMQTLQSRLNQLNNEIVQAIVTGKAKLYSNMEMMEFTPGTVEKINIALAKRNLILDMMKEEAKNP